MSARHHSSDPLMQVMILINRLALGFYFTYAGIGKFQMGLEVFYNQGFLKMAPSWLPEFFSRPYGYALPFGEVIFGILLMLGLLGRTTATVIMLMLLSIIIAQMNMGGFFHGQGIPGPYHSNLMLLTLSIWLIVTGSGALGIDGIWLKRHKRR